MNLIFKKTQYFRYYLFHNYGEICAGGGANTPLKSVPIFLSTELYFKGTSVEVFSSDP